MSKQPQLPLAENVKKKLTAEQKVRLNQLIEQFTQLGRTLNISYVFLSHQLDKDRVFENLDNLEWIDYVAKFDLTPDDLPILAIMVSSDKLYFAKEANKYFVPFHAGCAISQLKVADSEVLLINQCYRRQMYDMDVLAEVLPFYLGNFGLAAIPNLQLAMDKSEDPFIRVIFSEALEAMAHQYPETRSQVIEVLAKNLENYDTLDEIDNAFLIHNLVELKAVEQLPLIKKAFDAEKVDWSYMGDYEEIEIAMGVKTERTTPKPNFNRSNQEMAMLEEFFREHILKENLKEKVQLDEKAIVKAINQSS